MPPKILEKVPYRFKYGFVCEHDESKGRSLSCFDWEIGQGYRKYRGSYENEWEQLFLEKMWTANDCQI